MTVRELRRMSKRLRNRVSFYRPAGVDENPESLKNR
jgi:hypothetical protein